MVFHFTQVLFAISKALDQVEHDLLGVTTNHSKRIACIASTIGHKMQLSNEQILELFACCILHDSALTEYIHAEYLNGNDILQNKSNLNVAIHCMKGERNMNYIPLSKNVRNAVLYHHEHFDGSGTFRKKGHETPLFAQLIHLADQLDAIFDFSNISTAKLQEIRDFLAKQADILFDARLCRLFIESFHDVECFEALDSARLDNVLSSRIPSAPMDITPQQLMGFAKLFALIIDYKSEVTSSHSLAIAQKAYEMGKFYHADEETCAKLYFAGALHDIGKLLTDNEILEKSAKLTETEYEQMKTHVLKTYELLGSIKGLEDITSWASCHHEKLDGSGYPFGKCAEELGLFERLIACLDIYQALIEERSYKTGLPHQKAIEILEKMAQQNHLDGDVVRNIDLVFGRQTVLS